MIPEDAEAAPRYFAKLKRQRWGPIEAHLAAREQARRRALHAIHDAIRDLGPQTAIGLFRAAIELAEQEPRAT